MDNESTITLQSGNKENRIAFRKMAFSLLILTLVWIALQEAIMYAISYFMPSLLDNSAVYFGIAVLPLYLIAFPIYALLMRRLPKAKIERGRLGFGKFLGIFAICIFVMYVGNFIGIFLMNLINSLTGIDAQNSVSELLTETNPLVNFVFAVVLAPIFEELIFRKVLIDRAARYGEGVAVLMSGLLFGLFHMNLYQFFYAFFLGLIFAYIYVKTGRVIYTIILHFMVNFLGGIVAPYVVEHANLDALTSIETTEEIMKALPGLLGLLGYALFMLVMCFIGFILLLLWKKNVKFNHGEIIIPRGRKFSTVYLNIWMIILFVVFIGTGAMTILAYA